MVPAPQRRAFHQAMLLAVLLFFILIGKVGASCLCNESSRHMITEHPIVDVFMVVMMNVERYDYYEKKLFWLTPVIIKNLGNNTRIHVFTNDDGIMSTGTELGFFMHDSRTKFAMEHRRFHEMYKQNHYSVNNLEYEYLCFFRWHMFRIVVENMNNFVFVGPGEQKIKRVLTIDSDVVLFQNVGEFFDSLANGLQLVSPTRGDVFDVIVVAHGAVQLWTEQGIIRFSKYVMDWFNRPSHVIFDIAKQHQSRKRTHFSDMNLIGYFANENATLRNACPVVAANTNKRHRDEYGKCLVSHMRCIPNGNFDGNMMRDNSIRWIDGRPFGKDEVYPFCLIHFNGDRSKPSYPAYARYFFCQLNLLASQNSLPKTNHSTLTLASPFLVRGLYRKETVLINSSDCLKRVATDDELKMYQQHVLDGVDGVFVDSIPNARTS